MRELGNAIGFAFGHFVKGWLIGAGFVLGALNMWAYLGGVHP